MKCIVLAGGSGDRLWPLSRKNFPKQFMEIRKGRSMFQEAILRNMPFCDEFIIVTNKKYENIARGQLQSFQGLNYTLFLENKPLKTAPAVVMAALYAQPDEELLVVFTDHIIEGEYTHSILKAKNVIKNNKIAALGVRPHDESEAYHYLEVKGKKVKFSNTLTKNGYYDCGIYAGKASVFLQYCDRAFVERCRNIGLKNNVFEDVPEGNISLGLDKVINSKGLEMVEAYFNWTRITDISSYYQYIGKTGVSNINTIESNNKNVEIVNMASEQLIVANGLKDVLIANTRDALYITQITKEGNIKELTKMHYDNKSRYFDDSPLLYEKWGMVELLNRTAKCEISRITVFPNRSFNAVAEDGYSVNYFVVEGDARVYSDTSDRKKCGKDSSVLFKSSTEYAISNEGKVDLVMIQTKSADMVKDGKKKKPKNNESLVKLKPVFKNALWGGKKIKEVLKKSVGAMDCVSESWELSAHAAGQSQIATGKYKGLNFNDYILAIGKEQLGWKTQGYERFPLMIKFIDAKQSLSIQVHPSDDYAFPTEGDYGKNEMWYIMEADPGAFIYVGFNKDMTPEEIKTRIRKNTLGEVLNKVPVKKGEAYFLRAGTVHAIGAGCLICEIQQSSNITYRLYDYGRKDKNGKLRELQVDIALDVIDYKKEKESFRSAMPSKVYEGYVEKLIGECKYFSVRRYEVNGTLKLLPSESTFQAIVVIGGKAKIGNGTLTYPTEMGDTWFCGSWDTIELNGKCSVLVANI